MCCVCKLGFHDYWDQFIWGHSFETIHLKPRSFETTTFETTFIWDLFIWDPFIWDHVDLRPHSFQTTFIWDHIHLRPHSFETTSFETTFIWDHILLRLLHLRPHSFKATFTWDYINLRSHSFHSMLKWSCFDLLCITFYDLPFTFLRETWSFPRGLFIWHFARLRPSVLRGDSR